MPHIEYMFIKKQTKPVTFYYFNKNTNNLLLLWSVSTPSTVQYKSIPVWASILIVAFYNVGPRGRKQSSNIVFPCFLTHTIFTGVTSRTAVNLITAWNRTTGVERRTLSDGTRTYNSIQHTNFILLMKNIPEWWVTRSPWNKGLICIHIRTNT